MEQEGGEMSKRRERKESEGGSTAKDEMLLKERKKAEMYEGE